MYFRPIFDLFYPTPRNLLLTIFDHFLMFSGGFGPFIDNRQISHLVDVRLRHLLYDFFRGCFGPFMQEKQQEEGPKHSPKSHVANV